MPFSILLLLCAADLLQRIPEKTFKILVNSVQEVRKSEIFSLQLAKKVVSDSQGLVDFAIRVSNSVLNLSDR